MWRRHVRENDDITVGTRVDHFTRDNTHSLPAHDFDFDHLFHADNRCVAIAKPQSPETLAVMRLFSPTRTEPCASPQPAARHHWPTSTGECRSVISRAKISPKAVFLGQFTLVA